LGAVQVDGTSIAISLAGVINALPFRWSNIFLGG
jgi:hypothetical protein